MRRARVTNTRYYVGGRRKDYENLLTEGIREAVEQAVEDGAEAVGQEAGREAKAFRPIENARKWVVNEFPLLAITDGWCEEELTCPRDHCFVVPRKGWKQGAIPLRTTAPVFAVLMEEFYDE